MKKLKTLIVLTVISFLFLGCTGIAMSIKVDEESNKQDITKDFIKLNKNLRKFQDEEKVENLTFVIDTYEDNRNNNVKLRFIFKNNETKEYILKTNYPNEIEYDMKRMEKELKKVECWNLDKGEEYIIRQISISGYHIDFYPRNPSGPFSAYVRTVSPSILSNSKKVSVKSFFSVNDFVLFDKENKIYIDKDRKTPPSKDYINNCIKLKEILENDYKWLNNQWNLKFVLTSSKDYINDHCFPLNYLVIYIPADGYGDNFWEPVAQLNRIHGLLHEIIEFNIALSNIMISIRKRFFQEGLAEYLSKDVIKKMNKNAYFDITKFDYDEIKKLKEEEIDLKKLKYVVPGWGGYKVYPASQYVWERLVYNYKVDIEKVIQMFRERNILKKKPKHYEILITILSQESGLNYEEVEGLLKVNVSEMIGFYDKKYGFDTKFKDMIFVSVRFPYNDEIKDHHFFIDKYEVSNKEYCKFLNEMGNESEGGKKCYHGDDIIFNDKENKWYIKEGRENYPVINVSYFGARAYAKWCGKRLPTLQEYQIAAGKAGITGVTIVNKGKKEIPLSKIKEIVKKGTYAISKYSWGNNWDPKKCNWDENGEIDGFKNLSPVDSFPDGKSLWGCYNLVGNVWEYVNSEKIDGSIYVGGGYKHGKEFQTTNSKLTGKSKSDSHDCVGFRCVKDIE